MNRREFPAKIRLAAFERAGGICEKLGCNGQLRPGRFTYDHIIPDYFGGDPTLENCQVICEACNRDKTNKDASDIGRSRRLRKRQAGIRKRRTIRRWRKFNGEIVCAE